MNPIKTYSVWINAFVAVAGALGAIAAYLQEADPTTPLAVVAMNVVTLVARFWPQSEPAKKEPVQ
jgi:hypothetical protein